MRLKSSAGIGKAALHPVRLAVLVALSRGPATPRQLRGEAGVASSSLYRHLSALVDDGVIKVVAERPVRGTVERTYALADPGRSSTVDVHDASPDELTAGFAALMSLALAQFDRWSHAPGADPYIDGISLRESLLTLTDAEMAEFHRDFGALLARYEDRTPSPGARQRVVCRTIFPLAEPPATADSGTQRSNP